MLNLINQIVARAKANRQRIVLPEGTEERTLKAANMILTDEVADLILLGKPAEINELATKWGLGNIGKATIIDPETSTKHEEYAQLLCELRKKKGMTIEEARKLTNDPLFFGCLMMKNGDADGQLAGARNTTGNVLRPALLAPTSGTRAASACSSPSKSRVGAISLAILVASTTLSTTSCLAEPLVEKLNIATFGFSIPATALAVCAVQTAICAIWLASGTGVTATSPMTKIPFFPYSGA